MADQKPEKGKRDRNIIVILVAIIVVLILISSFAMVNVTVLDPQALQNMTLHINIT